MNDRFSLWGASGPFRRRVTGAGLALIVLFVVMAPQSSAPLAFMPRLGYWSLHIGLGLTAAVLAARVLIDHFPRLRDWRLVLLSGLVGVVLFAPIAYGLEWFFPVVDSGADNEWSDRLARTSVLAGICVEAFEMAPSFLAAWALINGESIAAALHRAIEPSEARDVGEAVHAAANATAAQGEHVAGRAILDRLPPAIGRELVAVSSDLHYLQVVTRAGRALILGSLQEIEDAFREAGLRVHRSHWVHLDAVVRLHKGGSSWRLELVDGHRVPVSRRKRSVVTARLGEDFTRIASAAWQTAGRR